MNDFQMNHLASSRVETFHAEAQRQRLAKSSAKPAQSERTSKPRRSLRFSLDLLLGRATA
jgi:hypothetical protein